MKTTEKSPKQEWFKAACILCSINCGIQLQHQEGKITKIQGDPAHPKSEGYLCQKSARLDYYQNHSDRLSQPLRRKEDGSFEAISWEQAITEIAAKLVSLRETHTGRSLAYYGGGGQGNHLGGVYGAALREAMGTRYYYSSLAQEKTGDFWVNGKLFGRQTCHITEEVEEASFVLFLGTNPWQAHGFPRARKVLQELSKDAERTMVVIDPRRTETAALADFHLKLQPGTDAFLLTAILAIIVQESLADNTFLRERTTGFEELETLLREVPLERYAEISGVPLAEIRSVAVRMGNAKSVSVRADLGIQQSLHSTLNSYLEKLLFLITGNLGKQGSNNFHSFFLPLIGHSDEPESGKAWTTMATGMQEISKLFPPNILPAEIESDHPQRIRGIVVDSSNPMSSAADTQAYRRAFQKLDLLVVIDVAMTETAELAHYVLPASSQFEKWEATFFSLSFPSNAFHLRKPIFPPKPDTLPEPEIYRRLLVAMGELPASFPLLKKIAKIDRLSPRLKLFPMAFKATLALKPKLKPYFTHILAETIGETFPNGGKVAAILWLASLMYVEKHKEAVIRAGIKDQGQGLGEALFQKIFTEESGTLLSTHQYEDTWKFIRHEDKKIHLAIPEMLSALEELNQEGKEKTEEKAEYPFILIAGERRAYNANTIFRNPEWRKKDQEGALRIHPQDAECLGVTDGEQICCESSRGSVVVSIEKTEASPQGVVSLPHGYGLHYPEEDKLEKKQTGPLINEITSAEHCDPITKTPYHKYVPVKLTRISGKN